MQAVILAAGKGTRLAPLTNDIPKPLIKVQGKPILEHILDSLPEKIEEIVIVIGYKGEIIKTHLGETYNGKKITYANQGDMHGTFGALLSAKPYITSETFLVMGADDIQEKAILQEMVHETLASGIHTKILPQKEYLIHDIVNGFIRSLRRPTDIEFEEPQPMSTGTYVFDNRIWKYEPVEFKEGEYGIPQTIRPMLLEENVKAFEMPNWIQINSHEDLIYAEAIMSSR